jgi:hypothetical protein
MDASPRPGPDTERKTVMDIVTRYSQALRTRRARTHQDRLSRAHQQAIRPASEDRYVMAFNVRPMG